jgi:hypothetical protein
MNSSNSSNSSSGGVILKPPAKQDSPKKRWCLTLNNYSDDEYSSLIDFFSSNSSNKWIVGKERGEKKDTPHLQMYINFKDKIRFTALKKINERLHIEPSRGDELSNVKYCSKEGDYKSFNLKVPRPLKPLPVMDRWWQKDLIKIVEDEPHDRLVYWYYSKSGNTGKTTFARYLHRTYGALLLCGKASDMKNSIIEYHKTNGDTPEIIIYDLPRGFEREYVSYNGLEEIKNMFFYSGKYEGGMIDGNPPHFIIFSNEQPDVSKMSRDRWRIVDIDNKKLFKNIE